MLASMRWRCLTIPLGLFQTVTKPRTVSTVRHELKTKEVPSHPIRSLHPNAPSSVEMISS